LQLRRKPLMPDMSAPEGHPPHAGAYERNKDLGNAVTPTSTLRRGVA
jgi:hypothetical protein